MGKNTLKSVLRRSTCLTLGGALTGALLWPVTVVLAQDTNNGAEEDSFGIEEIIVTARKREESLQEVPVSITAFSGEELAAKSLHGLREIAQFTPNFSMYNQGQAAGTSGLAYIRGIGQVDPSLHFDPGVGIYVDGIYMGRMQGIDIDLTDPARIEVLRGPQGTLFGKNTIGGAVNIISAMPSDEAGGSAQITVGRFNRIDGKADANIPLIKGKLAIKLSAATHNADGYGTRLDFATGEKLDEMGDINSLSGRALISWTPSENLDVLLSIDGTRVREAGAVRKVLNFVETPLVGLLNMFVDPDYSDVFATDSDFTTYGNGFNARDIDAWGLGLTVQWNQDNWSIKSLTSYRETTAFNGTDPDGSIYKLIDLAADYQQDQFSQEFQFSGTSFDDRFNWVVGLYYFEEDGYSREFLDVYREIYDFIGLDISFTRDVWIDNKSYAVFGQGTFDITDQLSATVGMRYTDEKKNVSRMRFRHVTGLVFVPLDSTSTSSSAVSPRASLDYKWNDDVMTYVSAARGFKGGGINGNSLTSNEFAPFDPEFVWTYEAGFRSDFADNRMRLNASFFYTDYKDIQFTVIRGDPDTGEPITVVDNAGTAEMKGFEVEFVALPTPDLLLSAGIGLTDGKYTSIAAGVPLTTDLKLVKFPKWSVNLSGQYTMPVGNAGQVVGRLDWVYKTEIHHDALNSPFGLQPSYSLLNARLTYENSGGNWSLSLFGTNLTDERYIMGATDLSDALGFAEVQYARPREWGLSLQYNF